MRKEKEPERGPLPLIVLCGIEIDDFDTEDVAKDVPLIVLCGIEIIDVGPIYDRNGDPLIVLCGIEMGRSGVSVLAASLSFNRALWD